MKKHLALSFISISFSLVCMSQKNTTEFGVSGGVNINSAYGESVSNDHKSSMAGFSAGVKFKYYTSDHFGIKALLLYDQNGWAYRSLTFTSSMGNDLGKGDAIFKLNYLTVPVLAEYSFGNKVKFKAGAGGFFGLLLNNQVIVKIKEPIAPDITTTTKSSSDYRKSVNFGLSANAGIQIPISSSIKFEFDVRDNLGLANIYKGDATIKTNVLAIQAGFVYSR